MTGSDPTPTDDATDQAAYWWARLRAPDCSGDERAAFAAWLTRDPAHRRAYDATESLWNDLGRSIPPSHPLRHEARAFLESQRRKKVSDLSDLSDPFSAHASLPSAGLSLEKRSDRSDPFFQNRRGFLGWAAAAMILLATGAGGWLWEARTHGASIDEFATAKGERREARLADGSRIVLNTDTRLSVRFDDEMRRVLLERGEAFFEVDPDPDRPFEVEAGSGRVRALGTRFNVYRSSERVSVALLEGRVAVELGMWVRGPSRQMLRPGEQIAYGSTGFSPLERVDVNALALWRERRLVFDATPLEEVLSEVGRYRDLRIETPDRSVLGLRVSGSFRSDDLDTLLEALPKVLPIEVTTLPSNTLRISRKTPR